MYFLYDFCQTFNASEQAIIERYLTEYRANRLDGGYKIKDFIAIKLKNGSEAGVLIPDKVLKNLLLNEIKELNNHLIIDKRLREKIDFIKKRLLNENLNYLTHSDLDKK